MNFIELCKKRYSVRKYADKAIESEKLDYILEAGRIAPTARNYQSQKVYVVKSEAALQKLRAITPMTYGAPVVLAVGYDKNISAKAEPWGETYDLGESDACIVATSMMYAAEDIGIGSLWARGFNAQAVAEALDIPANVQIVCLLDLGYAACDPALLHYDRKELTQTVEER